MSLPKLTQIKLEKWVRWPPRELLPYFASLIAESFKKFFSENSLDEWDRYYINSVRCYVRKSNEQTFRRLNECMALSKNLNQRLKKDPDFFNKLYKVAVNRKQVVKQFIKTAAPIIEKKRFKINDVKEFYLEIRNAFIVFFTAQVFPYLAEQTLFAGRMQEALVKHKNILIKWRKETHKTEIELEDLFSVFLDKCRKDLKTDFRYWTDYEILKYFKTFKKPRNREITKRKIFHVIIFNTESRPPYTIFTNQKANKICDLLEELTKPKIIKDADLYGQTVYRGHIKEKAFVIKNKDAFAKILPKRIIVTKVVEMDDFTLLKNKDIKGIIAEEGGVTTHIAIVGRELRIPIIAGIKNATKIIKNGDLVEVDADKGVVRILLV